MKSWFRWIPCLIVAGLIIPVHAAPLRGGREFRSLNTDRYEIAIQKNGRLDVRLFSGEPVFTDAFPMVWFAGEPGPRPLAIDGRYSGRIGVADPLGEGQGVILKKGNCEWYIRAYPTKPFFAVQAVFVNTTKRPVEVQALLPWCVGPPARGAAYVGKNAADAAVLERRGIFSARITSGPAAGRDHIAVVDRATGRSLLAGFITQNRAENSLEIAPSTKNQDEFSPFRAISFFDPPIVVPPGERLESEVLYLAVAEPDPLEGLERLARATAVVNRVLAQNAVLPNGWHVTDPGLSEAAIVREARVLCEALGDYGWRSVVLDAGWEDPELPFTPDPRRFPNGFPSLLEQLHADGLVVGLTVSPFLAAPDSAMMRRHAEWYIPAGAAGGSSGDALVLDASRPDVLEFLTALARRVSREWNFEAFVDTSAHVLLAAEGFSDRSLTRVEVTRRALDALRQGLGPDRVLITSAVVPAAAPYVDAVLPPVETVSEGQAGWTSLERDMIEDVRRRSAEFYVSPHLWRGIAGPISLDAFSSAGTPRTRMEALAWGTASLLQGATILVSSLPSTIGDDAANLLGRLGGPLTAPARPSDLFTAGPPRFWASRVDTPVGPAFIVGLFNWTASTPEIAELPLRGLGFDPVDYYTVYDFWPDRYLGTTFDVLRVETPPASTRLLVLRPYRETPMLVADSSDAGQRFTYLNSASWDPATRRFTLRFRGDAAGPVVLPVLVPEPFALADVSGDAVEWRQDGATVRIIVRRPADAPEVVLMFDIHD